MSAPVRGLRLQVVEALASFTYDDHKPAELRQAITGRLRQRAAGRDLGAADQQERRLGLRRHEPLPVDRLSPPR
jgi:transcriptional regulator